jgi:hypothetical protein
MVDAPKGKDIADPVLRESREQADVILDGLLTGKFDEDANLSPVARKLKGLPVLVDFVSAEDSPGRNGV